MQNIKLSLTKDYLSHWTFETALRELYQNVIDQQTVDSYCQIISKYDPEKKTLTIGNMNTALERKTLLLGTSTKRDNNKTLGSFGEGYKLALLVLTRLKKRVVITTGNELWYPIFAKDKTLDTDVLTILICKLDSPVDDLCFTLHDITQEEYDRYKEQNLYLQGDYEYIQAETGQVLTGEKNRGKIFINGLYISKYSGRTTYGYNFNSDVFVLGRDRSIIDGFDAAWSASKMIVSAMINDAKLVEQVIESRFKTTDTQYISSQTSEAMEILQDTLWKKFEQKHPNSIPVTTETEKSKILREYSNVNIIYVDDKEGTILKRSTGYHDLLNSLEKIVYAEPETVVNNFYDKYLIYGDEKIKIAFAEEVMSEAIHWRNE